MHRLQNSYPLADNYQGKKLNSPNDGVFNSKGDLFFTDPPYGLPKQAEDSTKEIPFQGVYRVSNHQIVLLTDSVTRPNGIALFPGEKTLIVANSDPEKAVWYTFDLAENDSISGGRVFYDATLNTTEKGLPDGLKIDKEGNVFATGREVCGSSIRRESSWGRLRSPKRLQIVHFLQMKKHSMSLQICMW
jgi:gluconolactonase